MVYGGRRPPRNEERSLFEATVAAEGVTTVAGNVGGTSFTDAGLAGVGLNSFISMMAVIHPGDPNQVDSRDITVFNNGTGEVTVASAFKGGQVAAGVPYKIVTFRFVPAEVAVIDAKIGTTADTPVYVVDAVSSIFRYLKGLTNATITAWGVADAGSGAGLIRDATRTEINDWWNGQTVLMLTGAAAFQKRPITDFLAVTDDIIVAPNFDQAVGAGDIYVILAHYNMIVPRAADDVANALTSQVIGRKDDTPIYSAAFNVSSVIRYLKGLQGVKIEAYGIADAGSDADTLVDAALTQGDGYWNGLTLLMITGNNAGLTRPIVSFTDVGDTMELRPAFPAAIVATDVYVILSNYHEVVPGADAAENYQPRDVIGDKTSTPIYTPDNVSDIVRYLKGILDTVSGLHESTESLIETWQDLLIDPNIWTVVNPATGAPWTPAVSGAFLYCQTTPNANETARLRSNHYWQLHTITPNLNLIVKKTILEFETLLGVPANVDNAQFFMGFTTAPGDTRASNNIIGFGLVGDALQTITDDGGAETVNTGFGETLTNHNKYRIEVYEGNVDFYLNEVLIANHNTNIPNIPSLANFFMDTEAGGACAFPLGIIKIKYEMVERY